MTRIRPLILGLFCVVALATHLMGAIGQVGTCLPNVTQLGSSIQNAVNSLPPNSTLYVCPGTYQEQVKVTKPITITGVKDPASTADSAVIAPPIGGMIANTTSLASGNPIAAQLVMDTPTPSGNINIHNLTVDGNNNQINDCTQLVGIYYRNASGTAGQVNAINQTLGPNNGCQSGLGIFVQSGNSLSSTVTVQNSYVSNYTKNGITANEVGTTVTLTSNTVFGQGPTTGAAENGIQFGFGAAGSAKSNTVMDNVYSPGSAAAAGILVYASANIAASFNTIGNNQLGISYDSDPSLGPADNGMINSNKVYATHLYDGIDLCSNSNFVEKNTVLGSDESGIHLDAACGSTGNSNNVINNVIAEACAGILQDPGTAGNTITPNTIRTVTNTVATGPTCANPPNRKQHGKALLAVAPVRP